MATYKTPGYLHQSNSGAFDDVHYPPKLAPYSGIYRCDGCGHEAVSTAGHHLPPQNHHQHSPAQGAVRWRLIVASSHA